MVLFPASALHMVAPPQHVRRRVPIPAASEEAAASAEEQAEKVERLKVALSSAIEGENYSDAAQLRDELNSLTLDDEVAVLQANSAFYEAFSSGDFEAMDTLWADGGGETCAHPGFPHIRGHEEIMDSWKQIFADAEMKIRPEGVSCTLLRGGLSAVVTCVERVAGQGANGLSATNIFEKDASGSWRMVLHQAGPMVESKKG